MAKFEPQTWGSNFLRVQLGKGTCALGSQRRLQFVRFFVVLSLGPARCKLSQKSWEGSPTKIDYSKELLALC